MIWDINTRLLEDKMKFIFLQVGEVIMAFLVIYTVSAYY
jgi:hypothetical protein